MAFSPPLTIAEIKSTPPGALKGILQFCEKQLVSNRNRSVPASAELEEIQNLADLIREELGLYQVASNRFLQDNVAVFPAPSSIPSKEDRSVFARAA